MSRVALESLESRRLLAADLSVAITATNLTDTLALNVKKAPAFTASYSVSNVGTAIDKKTKGNIVVSLVLHPATGADVPLGTAKIAASKLAKAAATGALASIGLGSTIKFKKTGGHTTANGFGNETGTFEDNVGKKGTYSLILGTGALLTLYDSSGATIGFGMTTVVANTNNGTPKIGGKTLQFGVPQAGSTGYAQFGGINGNVYYK